MKYLVTPLHVQVKSNYAEPCMMYQKRRFHPRMCLLDTTNKLRVKIPQEPQIFAYKGEIWEILAKWKSWLAFEWWMMGKNFNGKKRNTAGTLCPCQDCFHLRASALVFILCQKHEKCNTWTFWQKLSMGIKFPLICQPHADVTALYEVKLLNKSQLQCIHVCIFSIIFLYANLNPSAAVLLQPISCHFQFLWESCHLTINWILDISLSSALIAVCWIAPSLHRDSDAEGHHDKTSVQTI